MVKKKKGKRDKALVTFNKSRLKKAILSEFYEQPNKTFNYKQIAAQLGITDPENRKLVLSGSGRTYRKRKSGIGTTR